MKFFHFKKVLYIFASLFFRTDRETWSEVIPLRVLNFVNPIGFELSIMSALVWRYLRMTVLPLKWTSMRCRNKQKPIYFKEFLIFFLHSKCDMKLRLSILRSDIFLFCKNSSRRTHCVQMRMSPNNFDIFEVNKLRFQDEKCDFLKNSETLVKR